MKATMTILAFLLLSGIAFAEPFLICDPQEGVTKYDIEINGTTITVPAEENGSLRYDCVNLERGPIYLFKARAANPWGVSEWCSPLEISSALPSSVKNLKLASE